MHAELSYITVPRHLMVSTVLPFKYRCIRVFMEALAIKGHSIKRQAEVIGVPLRTLKRAISALSTIGVDGEWPEDLSALVPNTDYIPKDAGLCYNRGSAGSSWYTPLPRVLLTSLSLYGVGLYLILDHRALDHWVREDGTTKVSNRELTRVTGLDSSTVRKTMTELVDAGLVSTNAGYFSLNLVALCDIHATWDDKYAELLSSGDRAILRTSGLPWTSSAYGNTTLTEQELGAIIWHDSLREKPDGSAERAIYSHFEGGDRAIYSHPTEQQNGVVPTSSRHLTALERVKTASQSKTEEYKREPAAALSTKTEEKMKTSWSCETPKHLTDEYLEECLKGGDEAEDLTVWFLSKVRVTGHDLSVTSDVSVYSELKSMGSRLARSILDAAATKELRSVSCGMITRLLLRYSIHRATGPTTVSQFSSLAVTEGAIGYVVATIKAPDGSLWRDVSRHPENFGGTMCMRQASQFAIRQVTTEAIRRTAHRTAKKLSVESVVADMQKMAHPYSPAVCTSPDSRLRYDAVVDTELPAIISKHIKKWHADDKRRRTK